MLPTTTKKIFHNKGVCWWV